MESPIESLYIEANESPLSLHSNTISNSSHVLEILVMKIKYENLFENERPSNLLI